MWSISSIDKCKLAFQMESVSEKGHTALPHASGSEIGSDQIQAKIVTLSDVLLAIKVSLYIHVRVICRNATVT